jgi:MYND finger
MTCAGNKITGSKKRSLVGAIEQLKIAHEAFESIDSESNGLKIQILQICNACGEWATISFCAKCKTAKYCSRPCQIQHWPVHKLECAESPTNMMDEILVQTRQVIKDGLSPTNFRPGQLYLLDVSMMNMAKGFNGTAEPVNEKYLTKNSLPRLDDEQFCSAAHVVVKIRAPTSQKVMDLTLFRIPTGEI